MMMGVFASSITSGQIISRIGRYKIFPIMGTALMTIALALLSQITLETSASTASVYMLVLGLGLGMVMQILVMAVQNARRLRAARGRDVRHNAVSLHRRRCRRGAVRRHLRLHAAGKNRRDAT